MTSETRRQLLTKLAIGVGIAGMRATPTRAAETAPPRAASLTMQSAYVNDAEFLGYFIALQNGYYHAAGLDLHYLPGGPDIIPESALLSGSADIALTEIDTTVQAITRQGAPFRIIGTQFQKNPMGVISLDSNPVRKPADLVGKTLSVSAVSMVMVRAFLKLHGIERSAVRIVPDSQSDPTALLTGAVDATCGFITDFPYAVTLRGKRPVSFLLADYGLPLFNDAVVVSENTLKTNRAGVVAWLAASRKGWDENFRAPDHYPAAYHDTWLKPAARPVGYDIFSNNAYIPLMQNKSGIFSMDEAAITQNIETMNRVGVRARRDMFDTSLLAELA